LFRPSAGMDGFTGGPRYLRNQAKIRRRCAGLEAFVRGRGPRSPRHHRRMSRKARRAAVAPSALEFVARKPPRPKRDRLASGPARRTPGLPVSRTHAYPDQGKTRAGIGKLPHPADYQPSPGPQSALLFYA